MSSYCNLKVLYSQIKVLFFISDVDNDGLILLSILMGILSLEISLCLLQIDDCDDDIDVVVIVIER